MNETVNLATALWQLNAIRSVFGWEPLAAIKAGHRRDGTCCPIMESLNEHPTWVGEFGIEFYDLYDAERAANAIGTLTYESDDYLGDDGEDDKRACARLSKELYRFRDAFDDGLLPQFDLSVATRESEPPR